MKLKVGNVPDIHQCMFSLSATCKEERTVLVSYDLSRDIGERRGCLLERMPDHRGQSAYIYQILFCNLHDQCNTLEIQSLYHYSVLYFIVWENSFDFDTTRFDINAFLISILYLSNQSSQRIRQEFLHQITR